MKIPEDEELRKIIDKLANFVARNGPKFEELTKSKQRGNPKFSFLFGGDYHEYYKWKVSIEGTQAEAQQRTSSNNIVLTPSQPTEDDKIVDDFDMTEFKDLLQKLIQACTKDNIQNGKNWIVNNARTDKQLNKVFQYLLRRMLEESLPFQQKLHIVYLVNDILHHSRKKNLPQLQDNLEEYVLPIMAMAYLDTPPDNQAKLAKVVKIWDTQAFFKEHIRDELKKGDQLCDLQKGVLRLAREAMEREKNMSADTYQQMEHDDRGKNSNDLLMRQQHNANIYQQPPSHVTQPQQGQFQHTQFNQWNANQPARPPPVPDPFHYYKPEHFPPNTRQPPPPFQQQQQQQQQFQQGFHHQVVHTDQGMATQPGFQQFNPQFGGPPPQVQTFDYSHQSVPELEQDGGGGGTAAMTFDYEHGKAPVPDGAPVQEDVHDPTIPMAPYYDLPAGLTVPLVKLWDCEYKPLDPKDLRLPIPQPPSERLLAAIEAYYALPSHDRPRDSQGWEKNGLFEFYKAKLKYIKDKEKNIAVVERTPSPPPTPTPEDYDSEGDRLVTSAPGRSASRSPVGRGRSRSRSRDRRRSYSRSRSRSTSKSPKYRGRSGSRSRSKSRSRSPVRRSPIRRSPTPPEGFVGFETKTLDSRIEESNVGHQLLKKMGWGGQGLGKNEHGVLDPIKQGEVREKQDKFKGVGVELNDAFENYRKSKSYTYGRPRERR